MKNSYSSNKIFNITNSSIIGASIGSLSGHFCTFQNVYYNNETNPLLDSVGNGANCSDSTKPFGWSCSVLYLKVVGNFVQSVIWSGDNLKIEIPQTYGNCNCSSFLFSSTNVPSTNIPSTSIPSTISPTTISPSTSIPSTNIPSTNIPSTISPSTSIPSTSFPSTHLLHQQAFLLLIPQQHLLQQLLLLQQLFLQLYLQLLVCIMFRIVKNVGWEMV
eukprot:TRINITY_DN721_c0_g1_i4.p1 TRINITY_DN721_c0_g1~~TRINITY_DN721_c0_g1_i4.p1  ORF type:complete len:217 (-),score=35.58 TRINITY_DN721_c0_g1_i4:718-1368(-)